MRKKWTGALPSGHLNDGPRKQRTTQTTKPMGWKEERMGRIRKQNWKDKLRFWYLIPTWVGKGFFHYHQAILMTPAGHQLRIPYNSTPFWNCLPRESVRSHRLVVQFCKTVPHCRQQSQVQAVSCASDWLAIDQRFQWPPSWVWLIC